MSSFSKNRKSSISSMLSTTAIGLAVCVTSIGFSANVAFAQTDEEAHKGFDEIVVTARKREESVETTPIAISAFTGETMDERGIVTIADAARFVPNLNISTNPAGGGSGSSSMIFLRGVGQVDFQLPLTRVSVFILMGFITLELPQPLWTCWI